MRHVIGVRHLVAGGALVLSVAAGACVKDNTGPGSGAVVRDVSFVGYSTAETKQTTCGNCHIGKQREWIDTKHSQAFADLMASGHAQDFCKKCHTVNGSSNGAPASAGYPSVSADAKKYYQDVQCEACHGPGAKHVTGPDETQPIPVFVAWDSAKSVGCGTCHQGTHHPFIEEWRGGAHSKAVDHALQVPVVYGCRNCHEGRTALTRFGGSDVYVERTSPNPQDITCIVCHDPHAKNNDKQVRFPITERDENNLCIQCHHKRGVPDLTTWRGPHTPQGQMLLGYAGWQPAGFAWDTVANRPAHADAGNPDLCVGCHVFQFTVTDAKGQFAYQSMGHTFYGLPCLKTDGTPDTTNTCNVTTRSFKACASGTCHGSETSARNTFLANDSVLNILARALWVDANGNGTSVLAGVDTMPIDSGMLASTRIPRTEFKNRSAATATLPLTVAEGARFNVSLYRDADLSHGVHNPRYLRTLLMATIKAVNAQYGVPIPPLAVAVMRQESAQR